MNFIQNNIRHIRDFCNYLKSFHTRDNMHYVLNKNTLARIDEENLYRRLETQYSYLISRDNIAQHMPQASNKVWICWFQGEENAPDIVKACINSVKKNMPDKDVIIISSDNIFEYVNFPDYIIDKWRKNLIGPAHFSDLLRLELLCKYGGIWIDSTVLCTSYDIPKAITESPLFVFQKIDLTRQDNDATIASNWFISSWSNQPILLLTKELLYEYWRTSEKIDNYFLFHIFFAIAARRYSDDWKAVPVYNNQSPHTLQFELGDKFNENRWNDILKMSVFHKLNRRTDYLNIDDTFYAHILNTYLPKK